MRIVSTSRIYERLQHNNRRVKRDDHTIIIFASIDAGTSRAPILQCVCALCAFRCQPYLLRRARTIVRQLPQCPNAPLANGHCPIAPLPLPHECLWRAGAARRRKRAPTAPPRLRRESSNPTVECHLKAPPPPPPGAM